MMNKWPKNCGLIDRLVKSTGFSDNNSDTQVHDVSLGSTVSIFFKALWDLQLERCE